jgi:hypothetical protein
MAYAAHRTDQYMKWAAFDAHLHFIYFFYCVILNSRRSEFFPLKWIVAKFLSIDISIKYMYLLICTDGMKIMAIIEDNYIALT